MTIEKLLYLLTPPAVTKILQKLAPQKKTLFSNKPNAAKNVEEKLKSLREAHMDSPFKMIKVFLLLNDISIKNAPFSYYKKSHIFNQWRILKDLLEFSQCNKKYYSAYGNYGDIELNKLMKDYPEFISSRIDMTGKAGDIIISDNRGVHQGNVLYDWYRLQLGMVFSPLSNFDIGNIPKHVTSMVRSSK